MTDDSAEHGAGRGTAIGPIGGGRGAHTAAGRAANGGNPAYGRLS